MVTERRRNRVFDVELRGVSVKVAAANLALEAYHGLLQECRAMARALEAAGNTARTEGSRCAEIPADRALDLAERGLRAVTKAAHK